MQCEMCSRKAVKKDKRTGSHWCLKHWNVSIAAAKQCGTPIPKE